MKTTPPDDHYQTIHDLDDAWIPTLWEKLKLGVNKLLGNDVPCVAVIRLSGMIGKTGMARSGLTLEDIAPSLASAFGMKLAKEVAIIVNSPGGSPVQSQLICNRIRQLAAEKEKKVTVFIEDMAASGGYWLACSGDEIYAMDASIIGSIGVISSGFGFQNAIQKLGIERRVYAQGENKNILDPFLPEKPSDIAIIASLQKDIHELFKAFVRTRREGKLVEDSSTLFSGEFWCAGKAKELGLIDHIGDLYTTMSERYGKDVKLKLCTGPKNWFKKQFGLHARQGSNNVKTTVDACIDSLIERLQYWY